MNALLAILLALSPPENKPESAPPKSPPSAEAGTGAPATTEESQPAPEVDPVPRGLPFKQERDVHVDLLIIVAPEKEILPLLPKLRDPKSIAAAQTQLLELAAAGKVQVQSWLDLYTQAGSRATAEDISEFRYPIEFERQTAEISKEQSAKDPKAPWVTLQPVGATFETRNLGATLDAEVALSPDGNTLQIIHHSQAVSLAGMLEYYGGENAKGEVVKIPQPQMGTFKTNGTLHLKNGERRLIATSKHKPVNNLDYWAIMILGAEILPEKK